MTLQRRTPLQRKTPLRSTSGIAGKSAGIASNAPLVRGGELKRTGRLKPMSDKRRDQLPAEAVVRAAVFARDGHRCRIKPLLKGTRWERCWGRLTVHHLRKAGQCGAFTEENLISACAGHNGWVEDHPKLAAKLGLVQ